MSSSSSKSSEEKSDGPPLCIYKFVKGNKKGEICNKKCKEKYCEPHKKRKNIDKPRYDSSSSFVSSIISLPSEISFSSIINQKIIPYNPNEINENGLTTKQQTALDITLCTEKKIFDHTDEILLLSNFIKYICPISINFPSNLIEKLLSDTHIRNGFEVKKGMMAGARYQWESNMFNKCYDNADPFERVKYGSIKTNPMNMKSNPTTLYYGDAMFILKEEIKKRCTLSPGDSSLFSSDNIYTFDQIPDMLIKHNSVLKHIKQCYKDYEKEDGKNIIHAPYIEVQIHGPILLGNDISKIICNEIWKSQAITFSIKNKCEVVSV